MNFMNIRSDLAIEAGNISETSIKGVITSYENVCEGLRIFKAFIKSDEASKVLNKPMGKYYTFELDGDKLSDSKFLRTIEKSIGKYIRKLVGKPGNILVAGLGNNDITSDSIGPSSCRHIKPTYELHVIVPGVYYHTGLETADVIKGIVSENDIKCLIAIDSLAGRNLKRLCRTIQICDSGIMPGSGMGNHRKGINLDTMGIPVIAIGVPTVIDIGEVNDYYVTPKDIDVSANILSKCIGNGINYSFTNI